MLRITANSSLYMYKSGLMKNTSSVYTSMNKLMTYRNFDSYASDPAAATRAFQVHSSLNATDTQASNTNTLISKYETAWSNMETIIDDLTNDMGRTPALIGLNGTNIDALDSQAQILEQGAEGIIQGMNAKYNEDYIFAGADTQNPPFSIEEANDGTGTIRKYVAFRGVLIDHNLSVPYIDENGNNVAHPVTGVPMSNEEMLEKWNEEGLYVDIGLGFEVEAGDVVEATAFDAAISGLDFMGYGLDADGDPKNAASVMLRISDIYNDYDSTKFDDASRLADKLSDSQENMIDKHAELSAATLSLTTNLSQLESRFDALNVERAAIEDIDMADAIEEFMWNQTAYNAALQVGQYAIPQTLMDYMR